jgi:hypothetical protein
MRNAKSWLLAGALIVAAIIAVDIRNDEKSHREEEKHPETVGSPLSCFKPNEGGITSRGGSLVIKNNSDRPWTNLRVVLEEEQENGNFERKMDGPLNPGMEYQVGVRLFTRADGLIFDPQKYRAKAVSFQADQGSYGGEWCNETVPRIEKLANQK